MRKVISNWRYWVLFLVFSIAVIGIVSVPEESNGFWLLALIVSKIIGFLFAVIFVHLLTEWLAGGKVDEIADLIKEE